MKIEKAKAELQTATSGPGGRYWRYTPAISTVLTALERAERRIAELEERKAEPDRKFRVVGVMSEAAFQRLERSESRFIALWPRPGIYLPRKRPDDGVMVYAKVKDE